mmetsp:Transcript_16547/g.38191  ORF Transcript_16547/g.38191 Transcript_16547/m.38191 type:complete len:239 (-) Transcript_16547:4717-5433(-)
MNQPRTDANLTVRHVVLFVLMTSCSDKYLCKSPFERIRLRIRFAGSTSKRCVTMPDRFLVYPLPESNDSLRRSSTANREKVATCFSRRFVDRMNGIFTAAAKQSNRDFRRAGFVGFSVVISWMRRLSSSCRRRSTSVGDWLNSPARLGISDATRRWTLAKPMSQKITCPNKSKPRRPARPLICLNINPFRSNESPQKMVDLQGMLIPRASVAVAKTTFKKPFRNSVSTACLSLFLRPS